MTQMEEQEFFQLASANINDDPQSRLPNAIKEKLSILGTTTDQMMFDVHAHCFTIKNVPKDFMNLNWLRGIPFSFDIVNFILGLKAKIKQWTGNKSESYYNALGRRRFLENFTKKHGSADGILIHQYNRYNYTFKNLLNRSSPHIFIVQLMMDMERGITGKPDEAHYEQWKELSELRNKRQHESSIIPFLACDPHNPNLYEDFLAAFSDIERRVNQTGQPFLDEAFPFFGVKVYPCLGYLPSNPKLMNIFKVCSEKNIPVLTHCGSSTVRFSGDKVTGEYYISDGNGNFHLADYKFDLSDTPKSQKAGKITKFFNAPYNWIAVVEKYPKLKLNLAHLGGDSEWDAFREGSANTHIHETLNMIQKYPNVYTDISYAYARKRNLDKILEMFYSNQYTTEQREINKTKFMHGSDYYMTDQEKSFVTIVFNLFNAFNTDKTLLDRICIANPIRYLFEKS